MEKRTAVLGSLSQGQLRVFKFLMTLLYLHLTIAFTWLKSIQEVDQIAIWNAKLTAIEKQWWPHASWSCDGVQDPMAGSSVEPTVRWRTSKEGCHLRVALVLLLSRQHSGTLIWCALGLVKPSSDPTHTVSVLGRVTSPECLLGEVTGRKACSVPGLEISGKILCSRANFCKKQNEKIWSMNYWENLATVILSPKSCLDTSFWKHLLYSPPLIIYKL